MEAEPDYSNIAYVQPRLIERASLGVDVSKKTGLPLSKGRRNACDTVCE